MIIRIVSVLLDTVDASRSRSEGNIVKIQFKHVIEVHEAGQATYLRIQLQYFFKYLKQIDFSGQES